VAELAPALPFALIALLAVGVWALGLLRLDVFTPDDVRAWRRLASLRGYATPTRRLERAAARVPFLRRLQDELDLNRQLAIAGWSESPQGFLLRVFFAALLAAALFLGLLAVGLLENGSGRCLRPRPCWSPRRSSRFRSPGSGRARGPVRSSQTRLSETR